MRRALLVLVFTLSCAHAQASHDGVSASAIGQSEAKVCREEPDGTRTCAHAEGGTFSGNLVDLLTGIGAFFVF